MAGTRPRTGGPEALLEAALKVLAREGAGSVTVRRVAAEAGASPGTVTHHFGSVDELLVAALRHGSGQVIAGLERLALDLQDTDWDTAGWAGAFAAALAESLRTHPERHVACFELQLLAIRRPELRVAVGEVLGAYLRIARIVLRAVSAPDADADAARLVALTVGLILGELALPDAGREERLRNAFAAEVPIG
jgi:AcrR family transcriptional regulator